MKSYVRRFILVLFISTILLIMAIEQPSSVASSSQQASMVEIIGVLNIIQDDRSQYILVDNNGNSYSLDLDENLTKEQGGPLKLDRKEVVVNGILDPLTNTIKVLAIELANEVKLASNTTSSQNITNVNLTIVKVSGILNTIWPVVGPNVTANHTTTPTYYLVDNNGTSFLLDLDENLTKEQGGPLKLDRKEVVVNGILDPLTNTIKVLAIELANEVKLASNTTSSQNITNVNLTIVKVSGILNTIWPVVGPNVTANHTTTPTYYLVDNNGTSFLLDLDENLTKEQGGPLKLDRKEVVVNGILDPLTNTIKILAIELVNPPQVGAPPPTQSHLLGAHHSGPQRWAVILCRFGDATGVTPQPTTYYQNEMGFLDGYWGQLSYNIINLGGSQVFGWYNLPNPRSTYIPAGGSADLASLANDCTAAADPDINFPDYMGIMLAFNQDLDCCSWGGGFTMNRDGVLRTYSMTWMATWGWGNAFVMGHEMGHGFGLPHSHGPYGATYDSRWDVMSSWPTCSPPHPDFGCVGVHTIGFHKDALGWISSAQRYVATTAPDQSVLIERLALPTTSDFLVAQIPVGGSTTNFYTVEARKLVGFDDQIPGNAIVIHKVDTTLGTPAQVVDVDAVPDTDPNDDGAMWVPGEIFRDTANNIAVAVVEETATGFRIIINPSNLAPVASDQSVTTNQNTPVPITLSATDPDGDPITYSIVTNPAPFHGPSHGALNSFNPSTGTVIYAPTASYFGPDSFTFKATDNGGADSNIATVSITVKGPPDCNNPSIPGTNGNDVLQGTPGDDVINGLGGNDVINGNGGNDEICGADGNDVINSGDGNDRINGGTGRDVINSRDGNDQLYGREGNDVINSGAGNDLIDGGADSDIGNGGPGIDKCFNVETASSCEP